MQVPIGHLVNRISDVAGSWLLMVAGMAMISGVVLAPTWLEVREIQAQRDLLRLQAEHMAQSAEAFRRVSRAIEARDELLLERLAYDHLRLRPEGAELLPWDQAMRNSRQSVDISSRLEWDPAAVEAWLLANPPDEASLPPDSTLERLARLSCAEPMRLSLLAGGALAMIISLCPTQVRKWRGSGDGSS